jgi:hypothetical protein
MFSFGESKYQAQSKGCVDVQSPNMSLLHIMLFIFRSFHITKSLGISDMAPLRKTQNGNTYNGKTKYKVSGNEIKMTLGN